MAGIIYVLTNEGMPGLAKVGQTKNLLERVRTLSRPSGCQLPFEVRCAVKVEDADKVEAGLHKSFASSSQLWAGIFQIPFEDVVSALKLVVDLNGGEFVDDHKIEDSCEESEPPEDNGNDLESNTPHGLLPRRGVPTNFAEHSPRSRVDLCAVSP